jgi:predicted RNA-binding protein with PUA-like domain
MRDAMRIGDGVLFYHSGCAQPGIAGLAEVASSAYPDPTQFDPASPYYDSRSTPEQPRWQLVDVRALRKTRLLTLAEMRADPDLAELLILRRGSRLSVTPVSAADWRQILARLV